MILITSTGELLLYFTVIFFSFHIKKKKKSAAGSFLCCFCVALFQLQDCIFQWFELRENGTPRGRTI